MALARKRGVVRPGNSNCRWRQEWPLQQRWVTDKVTDEGGNDTTYAYNGSNQGTTITGEAPDETGHSLPL